MEYIPIENRFIPIGPNNLSCHPERSAAESKDLRLPLLFCVSTMGRIDLIPSPKSDSGLFRITIFTRAGRSYNHQDVTFLSAGS